jgi:hypothetical protein
MKQVVLNESAALALGTDKDIAQRLKSKMDNLKLNFYDLEKGGVDYGGMKNSDAFEAYKAATKDLAALDLDKLTARQGKLAFWINIYNALVIHGMLELNIKKSVKEVQSFFKVICYNVGGYIFSLDDIEHGILRGNKRKHMLSRKPFRSGDERARFGLEKADPRIHFALVCGSNSCPPIDVYEESQIDEQLDLVSEAFINSDEVTIDRVRKQLRVSRIFKWYKEDFGGTQGLLTFFVRYRFDSDDKAFLEESANELQIVYNNYDWSLNLA